MTNKRMYALEIDGKLGRLLYPLARAEKTAKYMTDAGIPCKVVLMIKSEEEITSYGLSQKTEAYKFKEAIAPNLQKRDEDDFDKDISDFKESMEAAKVKGVNHIPFVAHNELIVDEVKRMGFIVYRGNSDTISTRYVATVDMRYDQ